MNKVCVHTMRSKKMRIVRRHDRKCERRVGRYGWVIEMARGMIWFVERHASIPGAVNAQATGDRNPLEE